MDRKIKRVLLVEDDLVDAMTVKRAVIELGLNYEIVHATNGEEALEVLRNPDGKLPHLMLIDINMPVMNGIEFLQKIKAEKLLTLIPTIMLTTSNNDTDLKSCYALGIQGYFVKPVDYDEFLNIISTIDNYWSVSENFNNKLI